MTHRLKLDSTFVKLNFNWFVLCISENVSLITGAKSNDRSVVSVGNEFHDRILGHV